MMMIRPYLVRYLGIVLLSLVLGACAARNNTTSVADATPGSAQDFSVNVGDTVLFTVDSVTLSSTARGILLRQVAWLKRYPGVTIEVQGHADERGTREYNLGLSAQRAEATRSFLAAQGIAANRIRTISFGKERPVATCDAESCWTQNRRSVTVVANTVS